MRDIQAEGPVDVAVAEVVTAGSGMQEEESARAGILGRGRPRLFTGAVFILGLGRSVAGAVRSRRGRVGKLVDLVHGNSALEKNRYPFVAGSIAARTVARSRVRLFVRSLALRGGEGDGGGRGLGRDILADDGEVASASATCAGAELERKEVGAAWG